MVGIRMIKRTKIEDFSILHSPKKRKLIVVVKNIFCDFFIPYLWPNIKTRPMKFGIVIFPGTSSDYDMVYVLKNILEQEVVELWHKDEDLKGVDAIIIPGGFSHGDYLRAGALATFSPIMPKIVEFANSGGYVLGISNGFQILCEAKLLPGVLLENSTDKFECKNVFIIPDNNKTALTEYLPKNVALKVPVAHGHGRYYADQDIIAEMRLNEQILFRYSNERGEISDTENPNGSLDNIAGICNKEQNVFGIMPHPERAADEELGNTDGRLILKSFIKYIKERS